MNIVGITRSYLALLKHAPTDPAQAKAIYGSWTLILIMDNFLQVAPKPGLWISPQHAIPALSLT